MLLLGPQTQEPGRQSAALGRWPWQSRGAGERPGQGINPGWPRRRLGGPHRAGWGGPDKLKSQAVLWPSGQWAPQWTPE